MSVDFGTPLKYNDSYGHTDNFQVIPTTYDYASMFNLEVDPLFVNFNKGQAVTSWDLHLSSSSPLISTGSSGYDMGAYGGPYGNTWDLP
jgi:hypothetical protein